MNRLAQWLDDAAFYVLKSVSGAVWWVRHRVVPRHRYHVIDTGLGPGYHEIDERLLHGCMRLCVDYVNAKYGSRAEIQKAIEAWKASPETWTPDGVVYPSVNDEREALAIYEWWTVIRPLNHTMLDLKLFEISMRARGRAPELVRQEYREMEDRLNNDDQDMLMRLVKIRGSLWV